MNLFENTKDIVAATGEYSVAKLRKKFQPSGNEKNDRTVEKVQYWLSQEPYAEAFAQLYRIHDMNVFCEMNAKVEFAEIEEQIDPHRLKPAGQFYKEAMNGNQPIKQLALKVDLGNGLPFQIIMEPSDLNEARTQMRIAVNQEDVAKMDLEDSSLQKANKQKIRDILAFCKQFGFEEFNMYIPRTFDDEVDANAVQSSVLARVDEREKIMMEQLHAVSKEIIGDFWAEHEERVRQEALQQNKKEAEILAYAAEHPEENIKVEDYSLDAAPDEIGMPIIGMETQPLPEENEDDYEPTLRATLGNSGTSSTPATSAPVAVATRTPSSEKLTLEIIDEKMKEMLGIGGLNKIEGNTYIRKGLFHSSWIEYVVYDKLDAYKVDGNRNSKGEAQFTYAYKLFVSVDDDGNFTFSYRRNNGAKIDQLVNAMVGKFQDMGITHVNFPEGLPDDEKGLWRKALAEKGIVYKGMGIDVDKAKGMIKAAQEKNMDSEKLIDFKYRIALQMTENNERKHKTPGLDEEDFISGLFNTRKYKAFTHGYTFMLKGKLGEYLDRENPEDGAIEKIAAYRALRHTFELFRKTVDRNSILDADGLYLSRKENIILLSNEEKEALRAQGISGLSRDLSIQQMGAIFDILYKREYDWAKKKLYDQLTAVRDKPQSYRGALRADDIIVRALFNQAHNRCKRMNEELAKIGVDKLGLIESTEVPMEYEKFLRDYAASHPEIPKTTTTNTNTPPTQPTPKANLGAQAAIDKSRGGME